MLMAGFGAAASVLLQRRIGIFLTVMAVGSGVAFVWAPQSRLWNARLLPFWFLCLYLLAGVVVSELGLGSPPSRPTQSQAAADAASGPRRSWPRPAVAMVFVGLPLRSLPGGGLRPDGPYHWPAHSRISFSTRDSSFIPDWAKLELHRLRAQGVLSRVPRRRRHHEPGRQDERVRSGDVGVREGRRSLRHADGAHAPAVLDPRLHRLDGGPLLRVGGLDAVPLPQPVRAVAGARRARSATCPTAPSTWPPACSTSS